MCGKACSEHTRVGSSRPAWTTSPRVVSCHLPWGHTWGCTRRGGQTWGQLERVLWGKHTGLICGRTLTTGSNPWLVLRTPDQPTPVGGTFVTVGAAAPAHPPQSSQPLEPPPAPVWNSLSIILSLSLSVFWALMTPHEWYSGSHPRAPPCTQQSQNSVINQNQCR